MKIINDFELIEQFLSNKLRGSELDAFHERLKTDTEWANKVEMHKQMQQLIIDKSLISMKEKLNSIHSLSINKQRIRKQFIKGGVVVGLITLTIITAYLIKKQHNSNKPIENKKEIEFNQVVNSMVDTSLKIENKVNNKNVLKSGKTFKFETVDIIDTNAIKQLKKNKLPLDTMSKKGNVEKVNSILLDTLKKSKNLQKTAKKKCRLTVNIDLLPSCSDKNTGSLRFIETSIKNGTPPYSFSIDSVNYSNELFYSQLAGGVYYPVIKDYAGCIKYLGAKFIPTENCSTTEYIFAPSNGEVWNVPTPFGKSGVVKIFSKNGILVYECLFEAGYPLHWNGKRTDESDLLMGAYYFIIECSDGEKNKGLVTIVR